MDIGLKELHDVPSIELTSFLYDIVKGFLVLAMLSKILSHIPREVFLWQANVCFFSGGGGGGRLALVIGCKCYLILLWIWVFCIVIEVDVKTYSLLIKSYKPIELLCHNFGHNIGQHLTSLGIGVYGVIGV